MANRSLSFSGAKNVVPGWNWGIYVYYIILYYVYYNGCDLYNGFTAFLTACLFYLFTQYSKKDVIECFPPKEFEKNWIKYTNHYCWVSWLFQMIFNILAKLPYAINSKLYTEESNTNQALLATDYFWEHQYDCAFVNTLSQYVHLLSTVSPY